MTPDKAGDDPAQRVDAVLAMALVGSTEEGERILEALRPFVRAAMACEELWAGDYRNARNTAEIAARLAEARSKLATAYRTLIKELGP